MCALLLAAFSSRSMGDLAIWISEGQQIFLQKTIYIKEMYSINVTTQYPYPWLSSVIYFGIYQLLGIDFIFYFHRFIPFFILLFWIREYPQLLYKKNWWILVLALIGSSSIFIDRPALLALPLVTLAFHFFEKNYIRKKSMYLYILLFFWVQLHGSFVLYFIFFGWKFATNILVRKKAFLIKTYTKFFAQSLLITLLNPWGIKIYEYVYATATVSSYRMTEWEALKISGNNKEISIFAGFFVFATLLLLLKRKVSSRLILKNSTPLFIMMIFGVRNVSLFFITWPLAYFQRRQSIIQANQSIPLTKKIINNILLTFLAIVSLFLMTSQSVPIRQKLKSNSFQFYDETSVPMIFSYLQSQPGKKIIFNDWAVGSHMTLLPDVKIFIDTRNIIYSDQIVLDYENIYFRQYSQSKDKIEELRINYILIKDSELLAQSLQTSPDWRRIMSEGLYVLYQKN